MIFCFWMDIINNGGENNIRRQWMNCVPETDVDQAEVIQDIIKSGARIISIEQYLAYQNNYGDLSRLFSQGKPSKVVLVIKGNSCCLDLVVNDTA